MNEFKCPALLANSTNCGGGGWLNLTHVYGCPSIARVHPDEHAIDFFVINGTALMYFANDGGIYRALDGFRGLMTGSCGAGTNAFDDLNGTIGSMTQFVSFSQHPTSLGTVVGGTQDNGSPATNQATTSSSWINVNAGDGGYNEINPANPSEWFTANTDVSIQRCTSGIACTALTFVPVVTNDTLGGDHGAFYTPYTLDPQSAVSELLVGTCRVWRGPSSGATSFSPLSFNFETGATGSCTGGETNLVRSLAAGGPIVSGFSDVIYATTEGFGPLQPTFPAGGRVFRTLRAAGGATTWADVTQSINPDQYTISSVVVDVSDSTGQTAYVAIMGFGTSHVFKTTNAGASWADFSGAGISALPRVPANTLAIDSSAGTIYVGTDVGVFVTPTSAASWTEVGPAAIGSGYLPNVPVTKLRIFNSAGQKYLRASTYGRGVWQYNLVPIPDFAIGVSNTPKTIFLGQQANFAGVLTALNGYTSSVTLSCTAGITQPPSTCMPTPTSMTPIPQGSNFALTAAGAIGDYTFNVHAVGADSNSVTHDQSATLHIVDFALGAPSPSAVSANRPYTSNSTSLQLTAQGSFNQGVGLSCTNGLPAGATCVFSPVSASPTAGNPVTVSLAIATATNTPPGTYTVAVAASTTNPNGVRTQTVTLTVTSNPDFSITITGGTQSALVNQAVTLSGTLTAFNGYNRTVNLSCAGNAPTTCTPNPSSVTPETGGTSFSVNVSSSTTGTFSFNITASDSQELTHSAPVSLAVTSDFAFTSNPGTQSVLSGQTAMYSLNLAPVGSANFGANVTYTCSGLPSGAACNFDPPSIAAGSGARTVALRIPTLGPNAIAPSRGNRLAVFFLGSFLGIAICGIGRNFAARRPASIVLLSLAILAIILLPSCGGGTIGGSSAPPPVQVTIQPTSATVNTMDRKQFTAVVTNSSNTQVSWLVNGKAQGDSTYGTISDTGLYLAPATVPSPATFDVTAVSQANPSKSGRAAVTIQQAPILVSISPTSVMLFPSTARKTVTQQFTATVSNTTNTSVLWQVNGVAGGNATYGEISNTGLYSAPASVPNPASFNVTAVSQADASKFASAALTLQAPTPSGTYNVTITATSGGASHQTTAVLIVQ